MPDSMPGKDSEFDIYFRNIVFYTGQQVTGTPPRWTHIPQESFQELSDAYGAWNAAYEAVKIPHTSVQTAEKNRVRDFSKKLLREFINRFLRHDPVTNEDRDNMGIHNKKTTRTPVTVPDTSPQVSIDTSTIRRLIIWYKDEKSERRGKPKGVHGIEIKWEILDHPPASLDELTQFAIDTNPPLILEFDEADRGKHVYLSGSWEIEREAEKGPPGPIVEAVIP